MWGVWMWFGMAPGGWVALLLYVVRDSGGWGEENRVCVWRFLPLDRSGFIYLLSYSVWLRPLRHRPPAMTDSE